MFRSKNLGRKLVRNYVYNCHAGWENNLELPRVSLDKLTRVDTLFDNTHMKQVMVLTVRDYREMCAGGDGIFVMTQFVEVFTAAGNDFEIGRER